MKFKINVIWTISVMAVIIIFLLTGLLLKCTINGEAVRSLIEFSATLLSITLSIFAIAFTYTSNNSIQIQFDKIDLSARKIEDSAESMESSKNNIETAINQLDGRIRHIEANTDEIKSNLPNIVQDQAINCEKDSSSNSINRDHTESMTNLGEQTNNNTLRDISHADRQMPYTENVETDQESPQS